MDYHSLKRKELQALCKEHNIPANLANSVLADKLSALLNEKPKPKTRQRACIKSPVETTDEGEPVEPKRQAKKVRFSPNHDLVEYELRPGEKQKEVVAQTKTRRKSVGKKVDDSVDDNNVTVELKGDSEQIPVKVTRSRVQSSVKEVVTNNEKKKGKRGAKDVEKETVVDKETEVNAGKVTRSRAKDGGVQHEESKQRKRVVKEGKEETETVEETVVGRARVTRSKAQTLTEGGTVSDAYPKKKSGKQVMEGGTVSDANPKKKNGKQVKTVEQNVEPSNVPVRATRSRKTIKEDDENTVTNNIQTDKKRTRREMKATDSITNSIHVADKHEPPKRKSLRTSGTETVIEDESDKKEVVNKSRVTRSKAPLANETSGRNKNKASKVEIQLPVEPLKHEGKKIVNRRKSVLPPEKIEEAVNHPTRKNTRRKSVVQKAIKTVESPTVGKKQSKGLSGNIEDKENVSRPGKDAAETVYEEVTTETPRSLKQRGTPIKEDRIIESPKSSTRNASRSEGKSVAETPKSRKRRGTPIIENLIIENFPESSTRSASRSEGKSVAETPKSRKRRGAPIIEDPIIEKSPKNSTCSASKSEGKSVAETAKSRKRRGAPIIEDPIIERSPKNSTRSASKSEGKSVAKNPVESSLKKLMSKGRSSAISGAIINDSSSKKKAKLSETKQTDSEYRTVNSSKEWTPVAKMKNLRLDEVSESEVIPAIDKSGRRFTRSTFKEQPIAEAQLFSPKVANFRHDPAVNTAPGRISRRGAKHDGNAAGIFSEKVGKKKQTRQSAHKKPLDDAEVASSKVAVAGRTLDVGTIGVKSEVKQPDAQVQMSSPEVAEVGVNPDVDTVRVQSEIEQTYDDVQMSSHEVAEVLPSSDGDTIGVANSDGDSIGAGYEISKEVTGQTLGDLSASESSMLSNIVVEENIVSVEENASLEVMEDAVACNEKSMTENLFCEKQQIPLESQSLDAGTKLGENLSHTKMTPVPMADVAETVPAQNQNEDVYVESGLFTETDDTPPGRNPSVAEVSPVPMADVAETVPAQNQNEEAYVESGPFTEAVDAPSGKNLSGTEVTPVPMANVAETAPAQNQNEEAYLESGLFTEAVDATSGKNLSNTEVTPVPMADVAETVTAQNQNEEVYVESELFTETDDTPSGKNLSDTEVSPVPMADVVETVPAQNQNEEAYVESGLFTEAVNLETSVLKPERPDAKEKEMDSMESGSTLKGMQIDVMIEDPLVSVGQTVVVEEAVDNNHDPSLQISSDEHDVDEDANASAQKTSMSEPDSGDRVDVQENPFSVNGGGECDNAVFNRMSHLDIVATPMIGKGDVQDDDMNVPQELETGSELPNAKKDIDIDIERVLDDHSDVQDGESEHNQSANSDSLSEPNQLASNDSLAIDVDVEDDSSVPAQNENVHSDVQDGESEHNQSANSDSLSEPNQLASNDSLAIDVDVEDDNSMPAQNENVPVAEEADVPCDMVRQSDLVMSKDAPDGDTFVRVDALNESVVDKNNDLVSSMLSDTDDMEDEGDDGNKQNLFEFDEDFQPKESKGISSDMRIEQTKEEVETGRGNDLMLDDKKAETTFDDMVRQSDLVKNKDAPEGDTIVRVDALDESVVDKNDLVSSMWNDTDDIDDEGDDGNKHNLFKFDGGFQPNESKGISSDMRTEQTKEEVETGRGDDLTLDDKQAATTHEDPTREEASPISYTKGEPTIDGIKSSQPMGDVGAHESQIIQESSPIAYKMEESHVDDTESDIPNIKEDGRNKQDEPRSAGTSVDWGDYDLAMDELEEPGSANRGADVEGKGKTDVQDSDFHASARTSSIEESSGLAACLTNSVRKLEKDPRNADDGNSNQKVDILKESVNSENMAEDFNWPDSSLKSLFTTSGISKTSHMNDSKTGAGNSTFPSSSRGNEDIGSSGTAAHQFNHQWDNSQSKDFDGETQGNAVRGPSFEDYSKFFEDDVGGSFDRPESNTYFEPKQLEFSNEAAETSHHDHPSDLKDNSTGMFDKEVTQLKVSKADDDLAFDTGHA